ncbi:MAG: Glucosamine-6-phosphate deaminase [Bacillales bacterium]|jgi:glucosamine-6-phosphate deaminase|nr:Glucosamine-6-phosphate deaminase [Bacillales bacterium]
MAVANQNFRIITVADNEEAGRVAAEIFISLVREKPNAVLGLATGSSPVNMYKAMIKDYLENNTNYTDVCTFNLDEYIGLPSNHEQSYANFMRKNLFDHINIQLKNTHIPNGMAKSPEIECVEYEKAIESAGGVDLQILGIGSNGHIAFNEPGTPFSCPTHIVELTEQTRLDNARFFNSISEVPTQAITSGISTIMKSKQIVLIATGAKKANAIRALLEGSQTEDVPATVLKNHPNLTIIADDAALSK